MTETGEFYYKGEVDRMLLAVRVLAEIDLDGILSAISNAHALGPFIDPTMYRDALQRGDMSSIEKIAEALKKPAQIYRDELAPKLVEA